MRVITNCDWCCRKHACNSKPKEFKNLDFTNVVLVANCSCLLLPDNTAIGLHAKGTLRDSFNHCDDCDFSLKCKYYKHPEMLKEIDRVTSILCDKGYDNIRYTCEMHRSNTSDDISNIVTEREESVKKRDLFSWFKRGH